MSNRDHQRWLLILLGLFLVALLFLLRPAPTSIPVVVARKPVPPNVVMPVSTDWSLFDEDQLRQFARTYTEQDRAPHLVWRGPLAYGEACITSFQESAPGEFTFTSLTPTRQEPVDHTDAIYFDMVTRSLDVAGEVRDIVKTEIRAFSLSDRIEGGHMTFTDSGTYHLKISGPPISGESAPVIEIHSGYSSPDDPVFGVKK